MEPAESLPLTIALFVVSSGECPQEKTLTQIREVSSQEFELYRTAKLDIHGVLESFYVFVQKAMNDLDQTLNEIRAIAVGTAIGDDFNAWRISTEYRILNFCASVVAYNDRVIAQLSRLYGSESDEQTRGKQMFSELFDSSFAYRVVYNLRHALIHGSASLLGFRMHLKDPEGALDASDTLATISVPLSREAFGRGSANARVRAEVRDLDEDPDVLDFCHQTQENLAQFHLRATPILHPGLDFHTQYLRDLIIEASKNEGYPMMVTYEPNRYRETAKWFTLPSEIFEYVRALYENPVVQPEKGA